MQKSEIVFEEVKALYEVAPTSLGKWMWNNHVQWVADKAKQLAEKYGADTEKVVCAALLHDLGDSTHERDSEQFATWSEEKAHEILLKVGWNEDEAKEIIEVIIRPHSCRPGNLPTTQEGKVLSTADAMWHIQTSFFPMISYKNRPENTHTYEEWQAWFDEKIERDFNVKIFFEDEKNEVAKDYEALIRVFSNKTLTSKED